MFHKSKKKYIKIFNPKMSTFLLHGIHVLHISKKLRNEFGIFHVYLPLIVYQNLVLWFVCNKTMKIFCVYHNVGVMSILSESVSNTQAIVHVLCVDTATDGFRWPGVLYVALIRFPFGKVIYLHQPGSGMHPTCRRLYFSTFILSSYSNKLR